jgi:hypothetical protein
VVAVGSADVIADVSDILVHVLTAAVRESDAHARVRLVELVGQQRGVGHGALGLELFLYEVAEEPGARNRPSRHTVVLRSRVVRPSPGSPTTNSAPPRPEAVSRSNRATEYPDLHPSASAERWRHPSRPRRGLYVSRVPGPGNFWPVFYQSTGVRTAAGPTTSASSFG